MATNVTAVKAAAERMNCKKTYSFTAIVAATLFSPAKRPRPAPPVRTWLWGILALIAIFRITEYVRQKFRPFVEGSPDSRRVSVAEGRSHRLELGGEVLQQVRIPVPLLRQQRSPHRPAGIGQTKRPAQAGPGDGPHATLRRPAPHATSQRQRQQLRQVARDQIGRAHV